MPKNGQKWDHKVQNPKKTPKTWRRMQRRFFVLCPFFYALKKFENTAFLWALWYKKRRVLSVPKFLERDQKIRGFGVFSQKVRKSDFPRKRSQNPKKKFQVCYDKKNFFFGNFSRIWILDILFYVQNSNSQKSFEKMDFVVFCLVMKF